MLYKANVNCIKMKKWADAKLADYGGDDWGEDDEYDLPPSNPTGLRKQGQGIQSGPLSASAPIDNKKNYGEIPPLPGAAAAASSSRPRANSFCADDEKRNFSNATARLPSPPAEATPGPATRFSQITGVPSTRDPSGPPALSITTQKLPQPDGPTGLRKANQVFSPLSGSPHPDIVMLGPGRTNTGDSGPAVSQPNRISIGESGSVYSQPSDIRTPSSDYQARREISSHQHNDDHDITPTTTKHFLPQPALGVVTGAVFGRAAGDASGKNDEDSPMRDDRSPFF
jgi:hypothetical protein